MKVRIIHKGSLIEIPVLKGQLAFVSGYTSLYFKIENLYYSGVVDMKGNIVIPFSCSNKEEDFTVTTLFKDHKAIYGVKNKDFYLIDIDKTKFKIENDSIVPRKYKMKFQGYDVIDKDSVLIYKDNSYFYYDIKKDKKTSLNFDYIESKNKKTYGYISFIPDIYTDELYLRLNLNKNGGIKNPVHIGNVSIWMNNDVLNNEDKIKEEASKVYQKVFTKDFYWDNILH